VDIELARDSVTGRRRRASRVVYGTREDAELALSQLRVAQHQRRLPTGGTSARSVDAVFALYLAAVDSGVIELAPKTAVTTRSAARTMSAVRLPDGRLFGSIRLSRLSWQDVEQLYASMRVSGRGADWIRRCATVLSRALELARKRGLLDSNPCRDATRPRSTRSKPYAPTAPEVRALLATVGAADPEVADGALVLAGTGMRRGELLALCWADVDLRAAELHVAAAITDGGPGVGVVRKATKRSDWRDVPLTPGVAAAFERQRARRSTILGCDPMATEYVFAGDYGGSQPMRPEALSNRWSAAKGESSVTLLHLRHFAATAMLDAGESYRTVADVLGNSESTLRLHYDGRTDVGKRRAIAALELGV